MPNPGLRDQWGSRLKGMAGAASDKAAGHRLRSWRRWALIAAIGLCAIRVMAAVVIELLPQEAYYWNYAQHLAWGYLDHPPMVAWLIAAGAWLGHSAEWSVRLGALLLWPVTAWALFGLSDRLYGRAAAWGSLLLVSILPFTAGIGLFMTPDAPLIAAWAVALLALERALRSGRPGAWYVFGVALGLGLLSKYTIALLGGGALVFCLIDPASRRWLRSSHPYLALLLAMLVFSPVILWNMAHDWASFAFQGPGRWTGAWRFSLHVLLAYSLGLFTPAILLALPGLFLAWRIDRPSSWRDYTASPAAFVTVFTLVPASVFVIYACFHQPRMNWIGPPMLALIPALAQGLTERRSTDNSLLRWSRPAWVILLGLLASSYLLAVTWMAYGGRFPQLPPRLAQAVSPRLGWSDLARQVAVHANPDERGRPPVVVGMDPYNLASELGYYQHRMGMADALSRTTSQHLFGWRGLMFAFWTDPSSLAGRDLLLVSRTPTILAHPQVQAAFDRLEPLLPVQIHARNGAVSATFYVRRGRGFDPDRARRVPPIPGPEDGTPQSR